MSKHDNSRRKLLKAAVYTAPVIMTLNATPTFAGAGSGKSSEKCDTRQSKNYGNYGKKEPEIAKGIKEKKKEKIAKKIKEKKKEKIANLREKVRKARKSKEGKSG